MAKLIKKSKCTFEQGIIVKKDEQVGLPLVVWMQLDKLELIIEQFNYLRKQPRYQAGPSLKGFERMECKDTKRPYVEAPEMPVTDRRVAEAMKFMEEADELSNAKEINDAIDEFGELIDWCMADKFIEGICYNKINTPVIGNPLTLSAEDIRDFIRLVVENPIYMAEE